MQYALTYASIANIAGLLMASISAVYFSLRREKTIPIWMGISFFVYLSMTFVFYALAPTVMDPSSKWRWLQLSLHGFQAVTWVFLGVLAYKLYGGTSKKELWLVTLLNAGMWAFTIFWIYTHLEPNLIFNFTEDTGGFNISGGHFYMLTFPFTASIGLQIALRKQLRFSREEQKAASGQSAEGERKVGFWRRIRAFIKDLVAPVGQKARACQAFAIIFFFGLLGPIGYILMAFDLMRPESYSRIFTIINIIFSFFAVVSLINYANQPFTLMTKVVGISFTFILILFVQLSATTMEQKKDDYQIRIGQDARWVQELIKNKLLTPEKVPERVAYVLMRDPKLGPYSTDYLMLYSREGQFKQELMNQEIETTKKYVTVNGMEEQILGQWFIYLVQLQQGLFQPEYHGQFVPSEGRYIYYSFVADDQFYEVGFMYTDYRKDIHKLGISLLLLLFGSVAVVFGLFPLFFKENLIKPLSRLLEGVHKVEQGDLQTKVVNPIQDEFGILATSFNKMIKSLDANQKLAIEKQALEKDLEVTGAVQSLLIPEKAEYQGKGLELAGFYRSASKSGGDWWWYHPHVQSNKLLVLLGDVTGHGAGAAMVTAAAASYFQLLSKLDYVNNIQALLEHMDEGLYKLCRQEYAMSMSAVEVDYDARKVRFWTAGAPSIFIARADKKAIEVLGATGNLLGYNEKTFGFREADLGVGDRIFMFSDCAYEMKGRNGIEVRMKGLRDIFQDLCFGSEKKPLQELRLALLKHFDSVIDGQEQHDDLTYALVELGK